MSGKFHFLGITIACCCLLISASSAHSKDASSPLRMGIFGFFPWATEDSHGNMQGVTYEIAEMMRQELNAPMEIRLQSVARAFRDLEQGDIDLIFAYKDPVMLPSVSFMSTVGCLTPQLFTLKDSGISSLESAKGKRIGVAGGGYFVIHHGGKYGFEEIAVNSMGAMIKMMLRGRLDGFVANDGAIKAYQAFPHLSGEELPANWGDKIVPKISFPQIEVALGISKKSPNLHRKDQIDRAVRKATEKGLFRQTFVRWSDQNGWDCDK